MAKRIEGELAPGYPYATHVDKRYGPSGWSVERVVCWGGDSAPILRADNLTARNGDRAPIVRTVTIETRTAKEIPATPKAWK